MRALALLVALTVPSGATWLPSESVPLDRLRANVEAHFTEYPDQAAAHYLLGRLESLAFSKKSAANISVRDSKRLPVLMDFENQKAAPFEAPLSASRIQLFHSSMEHYRKAIALRSTEPLYHFSLGWMADEGQKYASEVGQPQPNLTWRLLAIREYKEAYKLSNVPMESTGPGPTMVAESGYALINDLQPEIKDRLANSDTTFVAQAESLLAQIRANLDRIGRLPRAITPLIFSTQPGAHLADLLSTKTVDFDLDGFTEHRSWPWLQPETAILVWDPNRQGHILSGRQLFGSVTWWMFWKNGFEPLAALDDNGDGQLTGAELEGIAVWQDRNGNGISDPGEVTPATEFGIAAIAVHPDGNKDGALANSIGIKLTGGRSFALFDWVTSNAKPAVTHPNGPPFGP